MPRKVPIDKLEVLGELGNNPDQVVGDFNESKYQDQFFIKEPQWDVPTECMESIVIRNSQNYYDLINLQKNMLENTRIQQNTNKLRIKEMRAIQLELREQFVKTNVFIKDCEDKTELANKTIFENKKQQNLLEQNVNKLKSNNKVLADFKEVLADTVKSMLPYEEVIQEVVKRSDVLKDVKDCMARCDALMLVQYEVQLYQEEKNEEIENLRKKMIELSKESALTVLGLNNELSFMDKQYQHYRNECLKWERILSKAQDKIAEKQLEAERMRDAIYQMYVLLRRTTGRFPYILRTDSENLFDAIKEEVCVLEEVLKLAKKKLKPED